ncbi:MAG TPA: ATP-binding protein, partial [Nitrospiria bacterium]
MAFRFLAVQGFGHCGAMTLAHLLRLAVSMALLVAVFWWLHTAVLLDNAKQSWLEESHRRLRLIAISAESDLEGGVEKAAKGPEILMGLAQRYGAHRIALLDREGKILMESRSRIPAGAKAVSSGLPSFQIQRVWEGAEMSAGPYPDSQGLPVRSYTLPIRKSGRPVEGVLRVDIEAPSLESRGAASVTFLLSKIVAGLAFLALGFYGLRILRGRSFSRGGESEAMGNTAAVIDTFHGLVRQLKEKEQEMVRLRAAAEERADHVESYNENILQSATSGVITFDAARIITTYNQAAEKILGIPRGEAVGKVCEEVFGEDSSISPLLDQALTSRTAVTRKELQLVRRGRGGGDSRRIWVGVSTSLLRDRQDGLIGTTFVFTDLTEIKSLQEQVELKRRLTVLGEMSAGIAHEFRNYMGSVMGFTRLLSKKLPSSGDGQAMIASIMKELASMNHLIEQLLNFGRHAELNLQPTALDPLVRSTLDQLSAQAGESRTVWPEVEVRISGDLASVRMDEVLMRQAVANLIQNAVDAMPQGGTLSIRASAVDLGPVSGPSGSGYRRMLSLEVQDSGAGIPADRIEKIFMPFFTTKTKGTGMGLAVVHKIVLSHGGRIDVDSREGSGTIFRIL